MAFFRYFRDVYLYTVPDVHVQDLHVQTDLDETYESGTLRVTMRLRGKPASKVALELKDAQEIQWSWGDPCFRETASIALVAGKVKRWSAEEPNLYTLYVSVYDASGNLVEVVPQKIGFRKFEMIDKVMHLNGKRIVFKGVNRHEFNSRRGRKDYERGYAVGYQDIEAGEYQRRTDVALSESDDVVRAV